ncbi:phosphotransferase [Paenibacillus sp. P3E]|uniref:phosphotransferase n=1 Tax=Paenibacillus sp. P3E TaxID=1349435 RepID=UPI00116115FA|nr:phosphotransferase [Paenibacillus sp. P3E]
MINAIRGIPGAESWSTVEPVLKGWSSDRKFYVEDLAGRRLLLRLSPGASLERKQREYEAIRSFNELDFPMSRAVDFGSCSKRSSPTMKRRCRPRFSQGSRNTKNARTTWRGISK